MSRRSNKRFEKRVEAVVMKRFNHYLEDIGMRIDEARELARRASSGVLGQVFPQDLAIPGRAFLAGFTLTNNTPAGGITWADVHIVYNGVDYAVTNGSATEKYIWWSSTVGGGTALQKTNTKPTLAEGEVLVFMNFPAGQGKNMLSDTNASMPKLLSTNTVDTDSIIGGAVGSTEIGTNAVTEAKINAGAVTNGKLGDNAVSTAKIATNAVNNDKLAIGSVQTVNMNVLKHFLY